MDSNIEKHDKKTKCLGDVNKELKNFTWSIKLSHSFEIKAKPLRIPRFKHAIKFLRPGYRLYFQNYNYCFFIILISNKKDVISF